MARLPLIDPATATGRTHSLLDGVEKQLGFVPNLMRAAANSPAALAGYLNLSGQLAGGTLDAQTRERIALAVAQENGCTYCLAAHSAIGTSVGLDPDEIRRARMGSSRDSKAAAAVALATALVVERGHVPAAAVDAARSAGLDNAEVVETIVHVALNTLTNYLNTALDVDLDFPPAGPLETSAEAAQT
jgi:uncharacterized peroxidase-related enzyme